MVAPLTLNADNLRLFCLSYYPDSQIALQPEPLWQYDRQTVVRLFFALLSGRALPTPAAHQKREHLLAWLPERLKEIDFWRFCPGRCCTMFTCTALMQIYRKSTASSRKSTG